ncbi:MAG: menaquinone biosynthesis protein [Planctomycetaceae bacterium]
MIQAQNYFDDMDGDEALQIGAVSYLNSKPLIEGLGDFLPQATIRLDYPSRLADALASGQLDVALIPSVESFADPQYEILSDACVATRGPVFSVKLYCRVHPGEIQTLALDEGSRTSAALVRVMLEERYGVSPQITRLPMQSGLGDCQADAVLLIGDRAMQPPVEQFHTVWDLGTEWTEWTGLPFVFAMWVTRDAVGLEVVGEALSAARDRGVERAAEIASREAPHLHLSTEEAHNYLTKNLHFQLGPAERQGLALFRSLVAKHQLIPELQLSPKAPRLPVGGNVVQVHV